MRLDHLLSKERSWPPFGGPGAMAQARVLRWFARGWNVGYSVWLVMAVSTAPFGVWNAGRVSAGSGALLGFEGAGVLFV